MSPKINRTLIYDTTLREGSQSPGISLSVSDKLRIAAELDEAGVSFIEGGMPETNPKEDEFYRKIADYPFKNAEFVPFGATARAGIRVSDDPLLRALAETPFKTVCIYGKCDIFTVENVLKISPEENIRIISDSVDYLKKTGKNIIFDCEGLFKGWMRDRDFSLQCLLAATRHGADTIVLCDSSGIADPVNTVEILKEVSFFMKDANPRVKIGVHMHNDCGMADANTVVAALNGADLVNTTLFGLGERCGNADFFTVVPNLQVRYGRQCLPEASMRSITGLSYRVSDILNIKTRNNAPFVGRNAFAHKAGTHINAVLKAPESFEPVDPESVGGERRLIASEISGRSGIQDIVRRICGVELSTELNQQVLSTLKQREFEGYQYESAAASLELLVRRLTGEYKPAFKLNSYKVITLDEQAQSPYSASAIVDLTVDGVSEITAGNGIGPVDALDCAFRRAMAHFYPSTLGITLEDYKVRVIDSGEGTASKVRVFIEFAGGGKRFGTVGLSGDIIQASWAALVDAYEYWIMKSSDRSGGTK
jgi:2-isopropylmalate synthase